MSEARHSGDRKRVAQFLNAHREYLRRVVGLRMDPRLAPRLDVSDIVQETHLEAVRRLDDYLQNPVISLKLWLRKLACERLIMAQRRHVKAKRRSVQREQRVPDRSSVGIARQLVAALESPSRQVSAKEEVNQLRQAMDRLCENDREIIMLHVFEGLTSKESATVLGIKPSAARKRLGRALQRLRDVLSDRSLGESSR